MHNTDDNNIHELVEKLLMCTDLSETEIMEIIEKTMYTISTEIEALDREMRRPPKYYIENFNN